MKRGNLLSSRRHHLKKWSGRRDSDPRHPAWEADTLPTELRPQKPQKHTVPRLKVKNIFKFNNMIKRDKKRRDRSRARN